jgi:mRNA-degrading endonuclease toxin of MazEF toxin-antitoxin module
VPPSRPNLPLPKWTVSGMISRGSMYFVNLDPVRGREQAGHRPVLVVSVDSINRQPLVITVVVGTDAARIQRDYPTNVRVPAPMAEVERALRLVLGC